MKSFFTFRSIHLLLLCGFCLSLASCKAMGLQTNIIDKELVAQTRCFTVSNVVVTADAKGYTDVSFLEDNGKTALAKLEYYIDKAEISDRIHVDKKALVSTEWPYIKKFSVLNDRYFPPATDSCGGNVLMFIQMHKPGSDGCNTTITLLFYEKDITKPSLEIQHGTKWGNAYLLMKPDHYLTIEDAVKGVVDRAKSVFGN
ncbi:MAG: hypothetical protein R3F48_07800 [Candidatus Zixiibacteriota bacterium]